MKLSDLFETVNPDTYRPTTAEQKVLLNLDKLTIDEDDGVLEQDIINLPKEDMVGVTKTNLDGAFDKLVQLQIIMQDPDTGKYKLSDIGKEIVEELKKKMPNTAQQQQQTEPTNDVRMDAGGSDDLSPADLQ